MEIIALSGFARSGKDEVAKIFVEEFGFTKVAFADKLRDVAYQLNPIVAANFWDDYYIYLQEVIDEYGWDGYKETEFGDEIRRLLQRLGTEAGRQTLWDSIWIDAALIGRGVEEKIVISDARFLNEFDAVAARGGQIWRVDRPGVGPANDHKSETEALSYKHFTFHIQNNGTLEDLKQRVIDLYIAYSYDKRKEWS